MAHRLCLAGERFKLQQNRRQRVVELNMATISEPVLTLVAGLTFGVSWLIALAMAVGLITPKVRGGASR